MALNDPILDARAGPSKGLMPAKDVVLLTKGTSFAETRALIVGTAGDLNIVTAAGNQRDAVPFLAGWSPIRITELLAGGSGDDVWGVYQPMTMMQTMIGIGISVALAHNDGGGDPGAGMDNLLLEGPGADNLLLEGPTNEDVLLLE